MPDTRPDCHQNVEQLALSNFQRVLAELGPFSRRNLADSSQGNALAAIGRVIREQLTRSTWQSALALPYYSVQTPMLVHEAIADDEPGAVSIGLAALTYTMGVNLLDDVLDGDRSRFGPRISPPEGILLGTAAIAGLAIAAILTGPGPERRKLQAIETLTRGSLSIAGGQALEMRSLSSMPPARALRVAQQKTGRGIEALCGAAGILAGASEAAVNETWMPLGFHLGCARQLASDIQDFADPVGGRDLATGLVSYPIALLLAGGGPGDGEETRALLAKARKSVAARRALIGRARERGVFDKAWAKVESHRARASDALARDAGRSLARAALVGLVEATPRA